MYRMYRMKDTLWCENCGAEILGRPVVNQRHYYCCQDCYTGLPCDCGNHMELEDERRTAAENSLETLSGI